MAEQEGRRRRFTVDQRWWLNAIKDHIAANLEVTTADFEYAPFVQRGGIMRAHQDFDDTLPQMLDELNTVLVA